ncbi:molecular chaperone TorD family protein, partial [Photobacterium damselae]|nr:molecular chaperone TorD family protein [Photobacterium damselae]
MKKSPIKQNKLDYSDIDITLKLLYQSLYFEPTSLLLSEIEDSGILLYLQNKLNIRLSLQNSLINLNDDIDNIQLDHLSLFVGLGMPLAPPWGSIYLNEENLLLRESTYQWMNFLEQQHFQFNLTEQQPYDHIGLMISVISNLWYKLKDDDLNIDFYYHSIRTILNQHLLPWSERFCHLVIENSQTYFYKY